MSSLEEEVRTLQKQVRHQRRWNLALGALVLVGGLMAATAERSVPDVIQAKKFEVLNDEGKAVVTLGEIDERGRSGGFVKTVAKMYGHQENFCLMGTPEIGQSDAGFRVICEGESIASMSQDERAGVVFVASFKQHLAGGAGGKGEHTAAALMASMDGDYEPKAFFLQANGQPLMFPPSTKSFPIDSWRLESGGRK